MGVLNPRIAPLSNSSRLPSPVSNVRGSALRPRSYRRALDVLKYLMVPLVSRQNRPFVWITEPVVGIVVSNRIPRPPLSAIVREIRFDVSSRVIPFVVLIEILPSLAFVKLQIVCLLLFVPQSMVSALQIVRTAEVEAYFSYRGMLFRPIRSMGLFDVRPTRQRPATIRFLSMAMVVVVSPWSLGEKVTCRGALLPEATS